MSVVPKTYHHLLTRGLQSSLATTPIVEGKLRYTTDTGRLYLDLPENRRIRISDIVDEYTEQYILNNIPVPLPKIYIASDTGRAFIYNNNAWIDIGPIKLEASSANEDLIIWFSDTTTQQASYDSSLTYNPSTDTLKVPNIETSNSIKIGTVVMTDTEDPTTHAHTIEFSFAGA